METAWSERVRERAERAVAPCASSRESSPPHVAFCVTGAARTFATPLVLTMLRHNLFGALGGAPSSRVFLQLKQLDSDKLNQRSMGTISFHQHNEITFANLNAAINTPWLRDVTGEAVIVNGSGAVDDAGNVDAPQSLLWRRYLPTVCNETSVGRRLRGSHGDKQGKQDKHAGCCTLSPYLKDSNNQERMLLHHLGLSWCRGAISRYEARSGRAFDMVVYTRPDLVWWKPVLPWCKLEWQRQIVACREPGCDMAWFAPRKAGEVMMSTAEIHRDCHAADSTCCSTSERLLWYAQEQARMRYGATVNMSIGKRLLHTQDAFNGLGAIVRAAGQPVSLLRFVKNVCNLAFDRAFATDAKVDRHTKDAFNFIPRRGLSVSTIASLRRAMNESRADCKQALTFVGGDVDGSGPAKKSALKEGRHGK